MGRANWYDQPAEESAETLERMRQIDRQYTRAPFYGSRRLTVWLNSAGDAVNRKRVQRLMQQMGLAGVAPGPQTSRPRPEHTVYPYLLRNLVIDRPNQVWCTDVTYLPMPRGFLFLVAILHWYSRYVLAWTVSNIQDTAFAWRRWSKPSPMRVWRSSLVIKGVSLPIPRSQLGSKRLECKLAWMAVGESLITSLLNDCSAQ